LSSELAKAVLRAVASYIVRKMRTFRQSPAVIAPTALNTAPYCPGASPPPAYQPTFNRSASCSAAQPTAEKPEALACSPGQVAIPSISARVSPASRIAAIAASTVSASADLVAPRETSDMPTPVIAVFFSA